MSMDALLIEAARSGARLQARAGLQHGHQVYAALRGCAVAPPLAHACSSAAAVSTNGPLSAAVAQAKEKVSRALHHEPQAVGQQHHGKKEKGHGHGHKSDDASLRAEVAELRAETADLRAELAALQAVVARLQSDVKATHGEAGEKHVSFAKAPPPKPAEGKKADADDDDFELFGSDDEEEEDADAARVREERLKAYAEKKSKKPGVIAKSSVVFDVKPWDDETDMKEVERHVRTIHMDGLVWGAAKLVPLAYGIKKLQIMCVVEDDKVSTEDLSERIEGFDELVQSVDIAAFQKI